MAPVRVFPLLPEKPHWPVFAAFDPSCPISRPDSYMKSRSCMLHCQATLSQHASHLSSYLSLQAETLLCLPLSPFVFTPRAVLEIVDMP